MELRRERNRHAGFVEVFNGQRRTRRADKATRPADVNGCADFRTNNRKLVIVIAINFAGKGQFVFQHHQCFIRNFADSQQIISHDIFFLNWISGQRILPACRAAFQFW